MPIRIGAAALLLGPLLVMAGKSVRESKGLADTSTVALDNRTRDSPRLGLTGRLDRIVGVNIPEGWKSGGRVYWPHRVLSRVLSRSFH